MSNACTPILVGVVSLVSEIPLLSKTANFPLSLFTTVFVYLCLCLPLCLFTFVYLSLCLLLSLFTFVFVYSPWSAKKFNISELAQKIHASRG